MRRLKTMRRPHLPFFFAFSTLWLFAHCNPVPEPVSSDSEASALYYLLKYGYVQQDENTNTAALLTKEGLKSAIKDFQVFADLPATGDLDPETVELMNTPRCGVRDVVNHEQSKRRKKRYALQGSRWRTRLLTYRITKYPSSRLSKSEVDVEIRKAFDVWEDQTDLTFKVKKSGTVHLDIRFERYEHGDGDPFDGPGNTLAHAYFPQYGGDAHFDDTEYWTIESYRGTNLFQTAAHEFGHSLGLKHSDVRRALMAPFYRGWEPNFRLNKDDIQAIQSLYGKKKRDTPTTTTTTTTRRPSDDDDARNDDPIGGEDDNEVDNSDLCSDSTFDTIFGTGDGSYYVFKGSNYWKLTDDSVESGYPRKIRSDWKGLPSNIDAAFMWPENDMTYIFKGDQYWKFDNQNPEPGYPKQISKGFPGVPDDVDAAFVWSGSGQIYFFKNNQYWRFRPNGKPPVSGGYPKPISNWKLPRGIYGAVQWNNKYTYFFQGNSYNRYNDRRFRVDRGDPPFPRETGPWWFGCPSSSGNYIPQAIKEQDAAVTLFDEEGDELLDVIPGDE